ncbi:MAG: alpha/beta-hydrolase family protein [Candidatus Nanopelagicales bacterium]
MPGTWLREDLGSTLAERTALMAAIGATGRTFGRSLMPRTTVGQALATGLTGTVNYGLLASSQSALWAVASVAGARIMPRELPPGADPVPAYRRRVRAVAYGSYAASALAAGPIRALMVQTPGESVVKGTVRTYLEKWEVVSWAGSIATALIDAAYTMIDDSGLSRRRRRALGNGLTVVSGSALAIAQLRRERGRRARITGERPPPLDASDVGSGVATALGLITLGRVEGLLASGICALLEPSVYPQVGRAFGHAVCLAGLSAGVWQGVEHLYRNVERAGSAVESLHAVAPDNLHVSGGPASSVAWETMSREGRRFAGVALSTAEIAGVMGSAAAEPVRVYVPLGAAATPDERARMAIAEMAELGAFERSVVVLCAPTGTGYVNYVMAESVEYLTRGDCAVVATQYSQRPSFLSVDRVRVGRANTEALIRLVQEHVDALPADVRPRLVVFGESLGAHAVQDVVLHRGARGFAPHGITRSLFIGTPDESGWAREWRADPAASDPDGVVVEVDSFDEFAALPEARRDAARILLVSHHDDPITRFGPDLAIRRPGWLDPDRSKRPPAIPPEMDWRPLTTFFVTAADVVSAITVVPGQFGSEGHDYREDLARFVSVAYDLPATAEQMERIEAALRRRELQIAESRLVADQITSARTGAATTLTGWGVDGAMVEDLISAEVARASRPWAPGARSQQPVPWTPGWPSGADLSDADVSDADPSDADASGSPLTDSGGAA